MAMRSEWRPTIELAPAEEVLETPLRRFTQSGFEVLDGVVDPASTARLANLSEPLLNTPAGKRPGVRRVLVREPVMLAVLRTTPVPSLLRSLIGPNTQVVRSILFDKTPETNWLVPWHQDPLIAVAERREVPGSGPWSIEDGEPHCRPPIEVLRSIVTIRIHLDACPADAGPLRGVVGSHRLGVLTEETIEAEVARGHEVEAVTGAGGVVLMSPLTIHSSPKATRESGRRRVLHLDCSAIELPAGLVWGERVVL